MLDKIATALLWLLGAAGVALVIILVVYAIPKDIQRTHYAERYADESGCSFIGRARDLNSVGFFQCGDDIKLKRLK